jgi:hypothetical protein
VDYLAERERLERLLEELNAESQSDVPYMPLGSLMDGWRTGDSRTRHDLVAAFFNELDVLDGQIDHPGGRQRVVGFRVGGYWLGCTGTRGADRPWRGPGRAATLVAPITI